MKYFCRIFVFLFFFSFSNAVHQTPSTDNLVAASRKINDKEKQAENERSKVNKRIVEGYKEQCPAPEPNNWMEFENAMKNQNNGGESVLLSLGKPYAEKIVEDVVENRFENIDMKEYIINLLVDMAKNPLIIAFVILAALFFLIFFLHIFCFSRCCRRTFSIFGYGDKISQTPVNEIPKKIYFFLYIFVFLSIVFLVFFICSLIYSFRTNTGVYDVECGMYRFLYEFQFGDIVTSENKNSRTTAGWFTGYKNVPQKSSQWIGFDNTINVKSNLLHLLNPKGGTVNRICTEQSDEFKNITNKGFENLDLTLQNILDASHLTDTNIKGLGHTSPALQLISKSIPGLKVEFNKRFKELMREVDTVIQNNVGPDSPGLTSAYNSLLEFDTTSLLLNIYNVLNVIQDNILRYREPAQYYSFYVSLGQIVWSAIYLIPILTFSGVLIYLCRYKNTHSSNELFMPNKCIRCCAGFTWILFLLIGTLGFILSAIVFYFGMGGGIPCYIIRDQILQEGVIPFIDDTMNLGECLKRGSERSILPREVEDDISNVTKFNLTEALGDSLLFCDEFRIDITMFDQFRRDSWVYLPDANNEHIAKLSSEYQAFATLTGIQDNESLIQGSVPLFGINDLVNKINELTKFSNESQNICCKYQRDFATCQKTPNSITVDYKSTLNESGSTPSALKDLYDKINKREGNHGKNWMALMNLLIQKMRLREEKIYVAAVVNKEDPRRTITTNWDQFSPFTTQEKASGLFNKAMTDFTLLIHSSCTDSQNKVSDIVSIANSLGENIATDVRNVLNSVSCKFLWKHLDLISNGGCGLVLSSIVLVGIFWAVLNFMCLIGFMIAFVIWKYLNEKSIESKEASRRESSSAEYKDEGVTIDSKESFIHVEEGFYSS